jgi:hypothetical protein
MIQLQDGCFCSEISIYPKNWNKAGASLSKDWYIQYYFHDPACKDQSKFKYGKLCIVKGGVNRLKTLPERRQAIQVLIENEYRYLKEQGYNPITKATRAIKEEMAGEMNLLDALAYGLNHLAVERHTIEDIKSTLKYFTEASKILGIDKDPVKGMGRKHILQILDKCAEIKKRWSANAFNKYRSNLMIVFKILFEREIIEVNPKVGSSSLLPAIRSSFGGLFSFPFRLSATLIPIVLLVTK